MRRKSSAQSLKSDSAVEDSYGEDDDETIFMADPTSSGGEETSDCEREKDKGVNEGTSLLSSRTRTHRNIYGIAKDDKEWQNLPTVVYVSPKRPQLPSPSASNTGLDGIVFVSHLCVVSSGYLPYNWRTPTMTAFDVQAHPFNRAPNANPQVTIHRAGSSVHTDTDVTGGSSRSSVWSVEVDQAGCCCAGFFLSDCN
jgi:hypothetical protein